MTEATKEDEAPGELVRIGSVASPNGSRRKLSKANSSNLRFRRAESLAQKKTTGSKVGVSVPPARKPWDASIDHVPCRHLKGSSCSLRSLCLSCPSVWSSLCVRPSVSQWQRRGGMQGEREREGGMEKDRQTRPRIQMCTHSHTLSLTL